jgi:4-diphosphocytidyl-2-C-methyl-D-erythritol kinase
MKAIYDVPAPAKLNLFLHITGRRPDGYHLLQSVFMLVDWADTLHFESRADGLLSREDLGEPLPADDLILRAARALRQAGGPAALDRGAHIGIDKRIPSEAGLGGGSSDAATTLLALNRLWNLGLPLSQLVRIGIALGADVPFFLSGGNAWVEGIGDLITPVEVPPGRFVVAKPPDGLPTARIFSNAALPRDTETAIISGFAVNPFGFGRNDLQGVACTLSQGVQDGLTWLKDIGLEGRMTGSGSAVFAALPAGQMADLSSAPAGFELRCCSNLQRHPLAGWA